MNPARIFLPMLALAGLTFFVLTLIPLRRVHAVSKGTLTDRDFETGESARVPPSVSIPNRNFMNLLEQPVLFYVACVSLFVLGQVDALAVTLAWLYVALRASHSFVHLTYNRVQHRAMLAGLGSLTLLAIWIRLLVAVIRAQA